MGDVMMRIVSMALGVMSPAVYATAGPQHGSAYDYGFKSIDGADMPLKSYAGRVLLVVNTASMCGFTPQYKGLQALYQSYEARGLTVIGVPSNDFGGQEPKGEKDIKTFCEGAFGVTFPLTEKAVVKGPEAHPFYKWVAATLGAGAEPRWNFHKIVVGRDGRVVAAFNSGVTPDDQALIKAIDGELARSVAPAAQ